MKKVNLERNRECAHARIIQIHISPLSGVEFDCASGFYFSSSSSSNPRVSRDNAFNRNSELSRIRSSEHSPSLMTLSYASNRARSRSTPRSSSVPLRALAERLNLSPSPRSFAASLVSFAATPVSLRSRVHGRRFGQSIDLVPRARVLRAPSTERNEPSVRALEPFSRVHAHALFSTASCVCRITSVFADDASFTVVAVVAIVASPPPRSASVSRPSRRAIVDSRLSAHHGSRLTVSPPFNRPIATRPGMDTSASSRRVRARGGTTRRARAQIRDARLASVHVRAR